MDCVGTLVGLLMLELLLAGRVGQFNEVEAFDSAAKQLDLIQRNARTTDQQK